MDVHAQQVAEECGKKAGPASCVLVELIRSDYTKILIRILSRATSHRAPGYGGVMT